MTRMRFGIFMAPFHAPTGQNPTTAYARDLATIQLLDELSYDEAWIGEHHSGGVELIPAPEIFIAHAAAQTRTIALATGAQFPYDFPDPFVLRVGATYHAYSTNSGSKNVPHLVSNDLANWTVIGDALPSLGKWATTGLTWAPSMMQVGDDAYVL